MKIEVDRALAIVLLKAVQRGCLDTAEIPEIQRELDLRQPARCLTKQEIRELWDELEREY